MFKFDIGFNIICRACGSSSITLRTRTHNGDVDFISFICQDCPNSEMLFPKKVNGGYEVCLKPVEENIFCPDR